MCIYSRGGGGGGGGGGYEDCLPLECFAVSIVFDARGKGCCVRAWVFIREDIFISSDKRRNMVVRG